MTGTDSVDFVLSFASIPFFIVGFIGNVLVIRIVHKTRQMHTTTNYLLANLAVSDVITILLGLLYYPSLLSVRFGKFVCKSLALTNTATSVSSLTLTLLAVERYHALLKPFQTGLRFTEDNIKRAIALIWISSGLFCLPIFFFQEWSETYSACSSRMNEGRKIYLIIFSVLITYIPMGMMLYCYGSLIKGLYFTHTICAADTEEDRSAEKKKLVVTFILATAGFFIGYGPIIAFYNVLVLGGYKQIDANLYSNLSSVFVFVFDCSLCLNPILYAFRSTNFKEGFKRIICCRRPAPQNEIQLEWLFNQRSLISKIMFLCTFTLLH